jgi:outer membrane receptor protein involved in Fe transport
MDLGMRLRLFDSQLAVQGAVFATRWSHIQSDYLLQNGLTSTRNVGEGRNIGVEGSASWMADDHWQLETGATLQHARLHKATLTVLDDPRLPVVPDVRLHVAVGRQFDLGAWQAALRTDVNYSGASRLSFEPTLDRKMRGYATVDASVNLQRGGTSVGIYAANVFDSHADTFAFGNPFSIRSASQHTPVQPRSLTVSVSYSR